MINYYVFSGNFIDADERTNRFRRSISIRARVCRFAGDGHCVYVTLYIFDTTQGRWPEGRDKSDISIMRGTLVAAGGGGAGSAIDLRINNIVYGVSKNDE